MQRSLLRTDEELKNLYDRHIDTVYRVCFMYMKNEHDTKDMVQQTFIRLMNDATNFESTEHEKAWLIRTATNLCKDYFKSWWRRTVQLKDKVHEEKVLPFQIDSTLEKVLNLPPKYKQAIYLYYYEGYSTVDIAHMFDQKESTIRGHLHAARKRLKMAIEREENRNRSI